MIEFKALGGGVLMPGKATRPDDGRRNNRGTIGNKGNVNSKGRPKKVEGQRGIHQIRAYEDEWEVLKSFIKLVRTDVDKCKTVVETLAATMK